MLNFPALDRACDALHETLGEGGFGISVWGPLGEIYHAERNWHPDTLVPVWSTTKGPAAATLLLLLEKHALTLETAVTTIWPEFHPGVTFAQILSHQAGLAAPEHDLSVFDHPAVAAALAQQSLNWLPGSSHGYHPRSYGFLLDEISVRLTGRRLGEHWREAIARPLGIDFFIGLPETEFSRVGKVTMGRAIARPEERAFVAAYMDGTSLTRRAFDGFKGLNGTFEFNHRSAWECGSPAFGGVGSARGIAQFYAELTLPQSEIFTPFVRHAAQTSLVSGDDLILKLPTTFTAGFQQDPVDAAGQKLRRHYGPNPTAFGHPGAGGSIGFADPTAGWGCGLVLNALTPGIFPKPEIVHLINALYD
jgi:CubicO group peptidase (beta-lactamase class C family)